MVIALRILLWGFFLMITGSNSLPLVGGEDPIESPKAVSQEGIPNGPSVGAERTECSMSADANDNPPQHLPSLAKSAEEVGNSPTARLKVRRRLALMY